MFGVKIRRVIGKRSVVVASAGIALLGAITVPSLASSATAVKSPITLMSISSVGTTAINYPEVFAGVQGAAKDVNAHGGVNGHPIVVITCNENASASGATACAQQAAANHATAVVGLVSTYVATILPILNAAKIPSIGSANADASEVTSPNSFTFSGGTTLAGLAGMTELINHGHGKIALVYINIPIVGPILANLAKEIPTLGNKTGTVAAEIPVSPTQTDMSTITAAIQASGATGINLILGTAQTDLVIQADYQGGIPASQVPPTVFALTNSDLQTLGSAANGIYVTGADMPLTNTKLAVVKQVLADFKSVHFSGAITDYGTQAWAATMAAVQVMRKFKVYTAGALMRDLPRAGTLRLGVLGPFNWGKPLQSQLPHRLYNPNFMWSVVQNGKLVPQLKTFTNILGLQ